MRVLIDRVLYSLAQELVKFPFSSRIQTSHLSALLKFACVNFLETPVYVLDTAESARFKIFRSSEMDNASG